MNKQKPKQSYETALQELQEIVNSLQGETLGMDDLFSKVERATELLNYCKEKLRETEEKMDGLFKG